MKKYLYTITLCLLEMVLFFSNLTAYAINPILVNKMISNIDTASTVVVKPINGTWINLIYQDVRNKYTNPKSFDNADPEMWREKVKELSEIGVEYLVFMAVANEGKSYYPSKIMPWAYPQNQISPVDVIIDEAGKLGMKVFMSTGWAKDQDDDLRSPEIKHRQLEIMEELASIYGNCKAFHGWYLPVEDCLCPIFADHAIFSVNELADKARALTPGKKILISPYGISQSDFNNPNYEKQLAKLKVDIIAYQDEVGCVREQFPLPNLKMNWKRLRAIHNKLNIELWANCETFTWDKATNDRSSALIPAAYPRLLSQQVAASAAPVDNIISFMVCGIIENPKSIYQLGQPIWSNRVYTDYMNWKNGSEYWKLFEASLLGRLSNIATAGMMKGEANLQALLDGKVAEENSKDTRWVKFGKGSHELVVDLQNRTQISRVMLRMLNYNMESIGIPDKVSLSISNDGKSFKLVSVKDAPYFPNNNHDAWIDGILFNDINKQARYVKISFELAQQMFMDELFINPTIREM